jgi:hypothetical protein
MPSTVAPPPRRAAPAADDELVLELEQLWRRPASEPASEPRRSRLYPLALRALVFGWPAFLIFISLAIPPGNEALTPAWVDAASVGLILALVGAGALAFLPWIALGLTGLAGGLGIAVGIACRATEHHLGSWWLVETAGFSALAALSVACLALRARR